MIIKRVKSLRITVPVIMAVLLQTNLTAADTSSNKEAVRNALTGAFAEHDVTAVDQYFADPYIQHNPVAPSGIEPLRGLVAKLAEGPDGAVEIHRIIAEGDLVAAHTSYTGFGPQPLVAFDIFRFNENGKIVEHWDNMSPVTEPNKSGRTQTDGDVKITDLDKTAQNKALVTEFITRGLINGEQLDYSKFISADNYLQHNSMVADGLDGLGEFLAYTKENNIDFYYTKLHKTVAEGNFVLAASEGVFGEKQTAYFDLFRLEGGLIVEHWDVIADMPSGDLPAGYPGKF